MPNRSTEIPWRQMPLLRLLLPFLLGLAVSWGSGLPPWPRPFGQVLLALALLGAVVWWRSISRRWQLALGVSISLSFFLLGAWRMSDAQSLARPGHFDQKLAADSLHWVQFQLIDISPTGERWRCTVRALRLRNDHGQWEDCQGRLLCYVDAWPQDELPLPGSRFLGRLSVERLRPPLNPAAFDYADYQARRQVYHRAFVEEGALLMLEAPAWHVRNLAERCRRSLLAVLRRHLAPGSPELAVGAALILGQRDELSDEVRDAYANTGAIHVLAVSGLHVGLVAGGLQWLLAWGWLARRRWWRLFLTLAGVWGFALITGLSPSVQRAATMFSFLLLGQTLDRRAGVYNALAASALILLCIQPRLLLDVGFQLSYLAVGGIVFFQPILYRAWFPPSRPLDYAWKLTSVSLAAQLTTFPLSLYYFHQFPLYFWLSGLVVVTAASFILGLGILLFACQWWSWLAAVVGQVLAGLLWSTNAFIFALESLPGGLWSGLWLSPWLVALLFLSVGGLGYWLVGWRAQALLFSLACWLAVGLVQTGRSWQQSRQQALTIYHLPRATALDYFDGRRQYSWSTLPPEDYRLDWTARLHRLQRGSCREEYLVDSLAGPGRWRINGPLLQFPQATVLVADRDFRLPTEPPVEPLTVDVVLLRDSPRLSLAELSRCIRADYWVFDGSNYPRQIEAWQVAADSLGLRTHATREVGALALTFTN
ncbi:MAG: ComEC/Rec2 family competence protein [Lewinella sp.]|nr:ComEC/Rec2 family competence protein [Lewinella sp.]